MEADEGKGEVMTLSEAQRRLAEAAAEVGREIRVFVREEAGRRTKQEEEEEGDRDLEAHDQGEGSSSKPEGQAEGTALAQDGDKFYEFTLADYARVMASHKEERFLKPRKIREQEQMEKRSRITKAVIRVLFPDGHVVESTFSPSHTVADVRTLITHCLRSPDTPFYFFTAPPKKRIMDETVDLYTAELAPGAIIHFAADCAPGQGPLEKNMEDQGVQSGAALLSDMVLSLKDLHLLEEAKEVQPDIVEVSETEENKEKERLKLKSLMGEQEPKKKGVPKWFKK